MSRHPACKPIVLFVVAALCLAFAPAAPAYADCTGLCQGLHDASSTNPDDVRPGDCKSGTPNGSEPDWQQQQGCSGIGGYGYYKSWTRTYTNITHDTNCINTTYQACQPCSFGVGQTGDCVGKAYTSVSLKRHRWEDSMGNPIYDHQWTDSYTAVCACGFHGCNH